MVTTDYEDTDVPKLLGLPKEVDVRYLVIQERAVRFNVQETVSNNGGKGQRRAAGSSTDQR